VAVVPCCVLPLCVSVVWLLDLLCEGSRDLFTVAVLFMAVVAGCRPYVCCCVLHPLTAVWWSHVLMYSSCCVGVPHPTVVCMLGLPRPTFRYFAGGATSLSDVSLFAERCHAVDYIGATS
jgi:hypothetical protein